MTTTPHTLDRYHVATVNHFCEQPKLANTNVVISSLSFGEDGVFYPPQDVTIYGPALKALRDLLNSLPTE